MADVSQECLDAAARVIVEALRKQLKLPKDQKDLALRKQKSTVTDLALMGVYHWIEDHFVSGASSASSPTE